MFHTFIDPDIVPDYMEKIMEPSSLSPIRIKYKMACVAFNSFYFELFSDMIELNKQYRFKVNKDFLSRSQLK